MAIHKLLRRQPRRDRRAASSAPRARWASPPSRCSPTPTPTLPYVREADDAVRLPGRRAPPTPTCAATCSSTRRARTGADAVHPGYGFLSENAAFAARVRRRRADVRRAAAATRSRRWARRSRPSAIMAAAGVPVAARRARSRRRHGDALDAPAADELGFPVLVKASFGGGGRGMRLVHDPTELADAVASAAREAAAAFGDGTVFLERFVESPAARRGADLRRRARHRRVACSSASARSSAATRRSSRRRRRRRSTRRCGPS